MKKYVVFLSNSGKELIAEMLVKDIFGISNTTVLNNTITELNGKRYILPYKVRWSKYIHIKNDQVLYSFSNIKMK